MTVKALAELEIFDSVVLPEPDREIMGVYIGDLLSWVMGRANSGDAWITIMSNLNIIAVASLADVSCIILAEGVTLDETVIKTASQKGVNVFSSEKNAYELATALAQLQI